MDLEELRKLVFSVSTPQNPIKTAQARWDEEDDGIAIPFLSSGVKPTVGSHWGAPSPPTFPSFPTPNAFATSYTPRQAPTSAPKIEIKEDDDDWTTGGPRPGPNDRVLQWKQNTREAEVQAPRPAKALTGREWISDVAARPTPPAKKVAAEEYDDVAMPDEAVVTAEVLRERAEAEQKEKERADGNGPMKHGVKLIPTRTLGDRFSSAFPYTHFNAVQSTVFPIAFAKPELNLVVSAPTGSGKTTIFELAYLRMLADSEQYGQDKMAIYMAPTKALCTERAKDWQERFANLGTCVEVTGDTGARDVFKLLSEATLVVTTPEKWDAITRRSGAGARVIDRLALMMIDEVHILRESRGATLEVVVSRMKTRGTNVRFVALSATVPNIDDIARWLGQPSEENLPSGVYEGGGTEEEIKEYDYKANEKTYVNMPKAKVFKFGEEYRPVKLKRETYGYDVAGNDFALSSRLDKELYPLLMKHSEGKPVLVFSPTRRACFNTAELVFKLYSEARKRGAKLPWTVPHGGSLKFLDSKLAELATCGIAIHHAGLEYADRREIETGFRKGHLSMIVSTSTLAVGVNLPAHLVIIKGTSTYAGPVVGHREYSDIDIQQMMGRAGRPQYDTSGTVVVMCSRDKVSKYRSMLYSNTVLESSLHLNLTEHINSEIGLHTITDLRSAQDWIRSSFLFIRIQQNAKHYAFASSEGSRQSQHSWEEFLDHYAQNALQSLSEHGLVECSDPDTGEDDEYTKKEWNDLSATTLGGIMSSCCISFATMRSIVTMDEDADFERCFQVLCGAAEFVDLRIRPGELALLNKVVKSPEIRFKSDDIKTYADKVFLHLQICFGNVDITDEKTKTENASHHSILMAIYQHAPRIAKAIAHVCNAKNYGAASRNALELLRVVNGKAWEENAAVFRQIPMIGPKSIRALAANNIHSFEDLLEVPSGQIEVWLARHRPFGIEVLQTARDMPRYRVAMEEEGRDVVDDDYPRVRIRVTITPLGKESPTRDDKGRRKTHALTYNLTCLFLRSDSTFINFRRAEARRITKENRTFTVETQFTEPGQRLIAHVGVDEVSGCATTADFDPCLPESAFPAIAPPKAVIPEKQEKCKHDCADKSRCGHECCAARVAKRPQKEKEADTIAPPTQNSEAAAPKPINERAEKQRAEKRPASRAEDDTHRKIAKTTKATKAKANSDEPLFLPGSSSDDAIPIIDLPLDEDVDLSKAKPAPPRASKEVALPSALIQREKRKKVSDSPTIKAKRKAAEKKARRMRVSKYIDDEAEESDDDGDEMAGADDDGFINDEDELDGESTGSHDRMARDEEIDELDEDEPAAINADPKELQVEYSGPKMSLEEYTDASHGTEGPGELDALADDGMGMDANSQMDYTGPEIPLEAFAPANQRDSDSPLLGAPRTDALGEVEVEYHGQELPMMAEEPNADENYNVYQEGIYGATQWEDQADATHIQPLEDDASYSYQDAYHAVESDQQFYQDELPHERPAGYQEYQIPYGAERSYEEEGWAMDVGAPYPVRGTADGPDDATETSYYYTPEVGDAEDDAQTQHPIDQDDYQQAYEDVHAAAQPAEYQQLVMQGDREVDFSGALYGWY